MPLRETSLGLADLHDAFADLRSEVVRRGHLIRALAAMSTLYAAASIAFVVCLSIR